MGQEREPWGIAVELHVLLCCPNASERRRKNLCDAIGAQMVEVTLEEIERDFPEDLATVTSELSRKYPDYDWKTRRQIGPRFIELHQRALVFGQFILPLISKAAIGQFPAFVGRRRQPTRNETARVILQNDGSGLDVGEGVGARGTDPDDKVRQFLKAEIRPDIRSRTLQRRFSWQQEFMMISGFRGSSTIRIPSSLLEYFALPMTSRIKFGRPPVSRASPASCSRSIGLPLCADNRPSTRVESHDH